MSTAEEQIKVGTAQRPLWAVADVAFRSLGSGWDRARWATLPADGNRYEVVDGVLYLSTAPSYFHQWIIRQIFLTFYQQIDQAGVGTTLFSPIDLFMPGCDPVQPDLLVIRADAVGMIQNGRIEGVPALLVEVLSPSNAQMDTRIKREVYARAGVPEYWIVRPAQHDVLVCSQPDATLGDYLQVDHVAPDAELASATLTVRAKIESFFAGTPDTTL